MGGTYSRQQLPVTRGTYSTSWPGLYQLMARAGGGVGGGYNPLYPDKATLILCKIPNLNRNPQWNGEKKKEHCKMNRTGERVQHILQ